VQFDDQRITSTDWDSYPILRFSELPRVDIELISRPDEPSLGVGEGVTGPTAAAIGNAVYNALGVRVRDLPLQFDRIVQALSQDD
jgi:CO/xanthine dehydrogenase Mo-binding subunit